MDNKTNKHEFACNAGKVTEYEVKEHIDTIMVGFRGFSKEVSIVKWNDKKPVFDIRALPIIPLHGLRHSCATLLNYLEVNIIEISKTLGHSTCSTTMNIYAHSFEEQQEEVATKVNEFLRLNA